MAKVTDIVWEELPALPPSAGETSQPGVAGPFAGVHRDALLVAGGANFPGKMPWEGGAKAWWDDIWVLETRAGGETRWVADKTFRLPRPLGYGISVSTPYGVVCAGGSDAESCYADVFLLAWDPQTREVRRSVLPSMPQPLSFMAGALVGSTLYVAGGQHTMKAAVASAVFWSLDLAKHDRPAELKWTALPTWPGPPRILPVAAAQRTAKGYAFFLFSGRVPGTGQATEILRDAYAFDPAAGSWRTLPNINGGSGTSVMAGTAAAADDGEILLFGGDRGELFLELEANDREIERLRRRLPSEPVDGLPAVERAIEERIEAKEKIYASHPGFAREVLAFDPAQNTWRVVGPLRFAPQVTTLAVKWGDAVVIPSGEIRPGVRTANVVRGRLITR